MSTKVLLIAALVSTVLVEELWAQQGRNRVANRRTTTNGNRDGRNRTGNRQRAGGNRATGNSRPCEEIQVPMCKGLIDYTHTKLPNRFNHTTQLQAYRVLEHMWALIDRGCSHNFRLLACSLFLPKCVGRGPGREPCATTCQATKRVCEPRLEQFRYSWPLEFDCESLPKKRCLKKVDHNACNVNYTLCEPIDLPMCQNVSFQTGMSPNMFGQCNRTEISVEMEQFRPLLSSNCSPNLSFFLCGVYMPFCTRTEGELSFPCQELCVEVRDACQQQYQRLTRGLPWPNKFQCHRYPSSSNTNYTCVMPTDGGALSGR